MSTIEYKRPPFLLMSCVSSFFAYLAPLMISPWAMLAQLRVHGYRALLLPLHPAPVRLVGIKNIYNAKPVSIHILGKPAVGDLKHPFKAAGSVQVRSVHVITFFSLSLFRISCRTKNRRCCLSPKPRRRLKRKRTNHTLEGEYTCRFFDLWSVRTLMYRLDAVVFKSTSNTNHSFPRAKRAVLNRQKKIDEYPQVPNFWLRKILNSVFRQLENKSIRPSCVSYYRSKKSMNNTHRNQLLLEMFESRKRCLSGWVGINETLKEKGIPLFFPVRPFPLISICSRKSTFKY